MNTLSLAWVIASKERGGLKRMLGIAGGVAVGVSLILLILAAYTGLGDRTERATWPLGSSPVVLETPQLSDSEVLVSVTGIPGRAGERYGNAEITRVTIASTPNSTVRVPGAKKPPAPGTYYASPELAKLIETAPAEELGDRFGEQVGILSAEALVGPESLIAIVGAEPETVVASNTATVHTEFAGFRYPGVNYRIVAIVGGISVLIPVAVLISIVTKLGQAARVERFTAIGLIGAGPRKIATLATIEAASPAIAGGVLGIVFFWVLRPIAAMVPVEGSRFFVADLHVSWPVMLLVAFGVALFAALIAFATVLRSGNGPLGATREIGEKRPRWFSMIPLVIGIGTVLAPAAASLLGAPMSLSGPAVIFGFLLTAVGLVLAGPFLSRALSSFGARRMRSAAGVLALNRIARHPRSTFRSVSGLVVALFIVTVFAVASTTESMGTALNDAPATDRLPADALVSSFIGGEDLDGVYAQGEALAEIEETEGVERVVIAKWSDESGLQNSQFDGGAFLLPSADATALGVRLPTAVDGGYVQIAANYFNPVDAFEPAEVLPASEGQVARAYPSLLIVLTDGGAASLERARTALLTSGIPGITMPSTTIENSEAMNMSWAAQYAGLAWVGILLAMIISVVSLSISTVASMVDRARVLGLLRLSGMPSTTLRRMIVIETAMPLGTVFLATIGLGFVCAWAIVYGLTNGGRTVYLPDPAYLGLLGICFALASLAILVVFRSVRSELPILATRFE